MSHQDDVDDFVYKSYRHNLAMLEDPTGFQGELGMPLINVHMPRVTLHQARVAGKRLAEAQSNQITVSWDATQPPSGYNVDLSAPKRLQTKPAIVVDGAGKIVLWYLPNVLVTEYEDLMWNETIGINELFRAMPPKSTLGTPWRNHTSCFLPPEPHHALSPGCISMSPGWFQRGQTGPGKTPEVSATLKPMSSTGHRWLRSLREPHLVIGAMTRIMNPSQCESGRITLQKLNTIDECSRVVRNWNNPFNALSVIANRETPFHRDSRSPKDAYDVLLTLHGDANQLLNIPTLGMSFQYTSGTMLAFSGAVLHHEVPLSTSERVCVVYYVRRDVQKWADAPPFTWRIL